MSTPTTGSSRLAISAPERETTHEALHRLTGALLERRTPGGWWEGWLSSSALATATAVSALACARRAGACSTEVDGLVERGIEWLVATRNADGAWGDTPDSLSNISTTALVWTALGAGSGPGVEQAVASAARWIAESCGGTRPQQLAAALAARYGKDRTFSVPILTMCAIGGRLGTGRAAWELVPPLPFELATLPRGLFGALRLPVVSYALPALIAMGVAGHRNRPSGRRVSAVRELAVPRVLRVLEGLQPPNGGFLEAVPLTSFVVMSLVAAGEADHSAVRLGLDFLVRSARRDGSWPVDTNLATWTTTLAVNALAGGPAWAQLEPCDRAKIRDWLLGQQWTIRHPYTGAAPGGWAWTDLPGGVPDADDTAGALLALAHLDPDHAGVREAAAGGVRWLLGLQNRDGGIPTFCRGWGTLPFDRSATDLTAHAIRAWCAWRPRLETAERPRVSRAIRRALAFLQRTQRADGAFVPLWFGNQREAREENPVFGTGRVLDGLAAAAAAEPGAGASAMLERAKAYLLAAQDADGAWGGGPGVPPSLEETATAVAGLAGGPTVPGQRGAIDRGVAWLHRTTDGFQRFEPSPIGLYFARLWYTEQLYAPVFTTAALGRVTMGTTPPGGS